MTGTAIVVVSILAIIVLLSLFGFGFIPMPLQAGGPYGPTVCESDTSPNLLRGIVFS